MFASDRADVKYRPPRGHSWVEFRRRGRRKAVSSRNSLDVIEEAGKGKCSFYDDRKEDCDYRVQRVSRRSRLFAPQALSHDMNIVKRKLGRLNCKTDRIYRFPSTARGVCAARKHEVNFLRKSRDIISRENRRWLDAFRTVYHIRCTSLIMSVLKSNILFHEIICTDLK